MYTARNFFLLLAMIIFLSVAYYFLFALPAHNRKILQLEREKIEAAQKAKGEEEQERRIREEAQRAQQAVEKQSREFNEFVKRDEAKERERIKRIEAENERNKAEDKERNRQRKLDYCLQAAEDAYWTHIEANALSRKPGGSYLVHRDILELERRKKKDAVDECYRRWGH